MTMPNDIRHFPGGDPTDTVDSQPPALREYAKEHFDRSNDCQWLHALVCSNAIPTGRISPQYLVRVHYKDAKSVSTTITQDFGTGSHAMTDLRRCLASKYVQAVTLCHRDSSQVDPEILDLLWSTFHLEVSFLRQHLDYKEFRNETGCPEIISDCLKEESGRVEGYMDLWRSLESHPTSVRDSGFRFASKCRLGVLICLLQRWCYYGVTGIVLVRSKGVYLTPLERWEQPGSAGRSKPCTDLFAATVDASSKDRELPSDPTEFSFSIVHFYARLLLLRCYEDYYLRHDPEPIVVDDSDRVGLPYIKAMHSRRLELVKFRQHLSVYLGPLTTEREESTLSDYEHWRKLHDLLVDVEMLSSLYDSTMRVYDCHIHELNSDFRADLASEQLEETRESKATAISLGKLSNLAFLYIPFNFVCAMLGMNLSIFGQGVVPVWVFLMLLLFFGLLTYIPMYAPMINEQRREAYRVAYHLAMRSIPAGFWYFVFYSTHNPQQNFEILNAGLSQTFLGQTIYKSKGWQDGGLFKNASWGSEAFWKEKVKRIFLSVKELNQPDERRTQLTV